MAEDRWYKVDNVSKVFLASMTRRDTRAFRVSCSLKEKIESEILQQALLKACRQRPQFQVSIRRGVFWHYMEVTNVEPVVEEEKTRPCPTLYGPGYEGKLHYKVSYFGNRINLDMFHVLADGNGGLEFLNVIVLNYLQIKHPGQLDDVPIFSGASAADLEEDSFKQFYGKKGKIGELAKKCYHIRGLKHPYDQLQFMEIRLPVKDVLAKAKEAGGTMTSFLGATLMMSVYKDMPALQRNKPISISMPVNLRNFYPSATSRNFFNSVTVSHVFTGEETINEMTRKFDEKLKAELTPERICQRMDNYEQLEQLILVRMVPLFIKNPVVRYFAKQEAKCVTAVISNLGKLKLPEELSEYIEGYAAFCSTNTLFITSCSYGEYLTLGVASAYRNTNVLCKFVKSFTDQGIDASVYANEIVY